MLALQFEDYEKEIRSHLGGMLPKELSKVGTRLTKFHRGYIEALGQVDERINEEQLTRNYGTSQA